MFKVKHVKSNVLSCPNGHDLPEASLSRGMVFCPECGENLLAELLPCDYVFCSGCLNRVEPEWNYCPYCGKSKEGD
jgi:hypothetical protein